MAKFVAFNGGIFYAEIIANLQSGYSYAYFFVFEENCLFFLTRTHTTTPVYTTCPTSDMISIADTTPSAVE